MLNKRLGVALSALLIVATSCVPREYNEIQLSSVKVLGDESLPQLADAAGHMPMILKRLKFVSQPAAKNEAAARIAKYLSFLGMEPGSELANATTKRLLDSSTQFLFCDDMDDWDCLERDPAIVPVAAFRRSVIPNLGKRIDVNDTLKVELFFTERWRNRMANKPEIVVAPIGPTISNKLAEKIEQFGTKSISMAVYGLDDITESMRPVFDAVMSRKRKGSKVRAVLDMEGPKKGAVAPFVFSYLRPTFKPESWILNETTRPIKYEYTESPMIARLLNEGARSNEEAMARIEFPNSGIMHNKFVVLENENGRSLWSGTANMSAECMGEEKNANVGIFIKNEEIAKSFLTQFDHMFEVDTKNPVKQKNFIGEDGNDLIFSGRFHNNKIPVSNRYFKFADGNEVRIHFSPTDDAEHRLHIPMIHSARRGDVIRISMFVSSGDEYVRALQLAAARGVDVRIVHGATNGMGPGSWIRDEFANVKMPNPYSASVPGKTDALLSDWQRFNHHKSATLTRANGRVEMIIIGSQNWTKPGNDQNDENSIAIRNLKKSVPHGLEYNSHFDEKLVKSSITVEQSLLRRETN